MLFLFKKYASVANLSEEETTPACLQLVGHIGQIYQTFLTNGGKYFGLFLTNLAVFGTFRSRQTGVKISLEAKLNDEI